MPAEAPGPASAIAERRHICVVTETYPPEVNGVALTLSNLVKGLISRGHKVSMVRPRQRQADCCGRGYDPSVTLVRGLPLPGYKGLQFGLPGRHITMACVDQRPSGRSVCRDRRSARMVGGPDRGFAENSKLQRLSHQLP